MKQRQNDSGRWELWFPTCKVWFEEADLGAAMFHGLTHDPEVFELVKRVSPGTRIHEDKGH